MYTGVWVNEYMVPPTSCLCERKLYMGPYASHMYSVNIVLPVCVLVT